MGKFDGKVAVVTGARRGIGKAIAIELAREGADLALNDLESLDGADGVAQQVQSLGSRIAVVKGDVSRYGDVQEIVDQTVERLGQLDILVNNAGVESIVGVLDLSVQEWERVTNTNLKGSFLCAQAAARYMIGDGRPGVVVNIGSVQASLVLPGRTHYAPTKRALESLTANLAVELAQHMIRVNCVHPGLIETPMTDWVFNDAEVLPQVLAKIPAGRAGQPSEIAKAVMFLASEDASYVTGQSIYVDGGFSIPG